MEPQPGANPQPASPGTPQNGAEESTEPQTGPGRIITFYSYKGGTGRSMALANAAWALAMAGKRVLVMDWDLEAPGVHRYFHPFLKDPDLSSTDGVIEYLTRMARTAAAQPIDTDWRKVDDGFFEELADPGSFVQTLDFKDFPDNGLIRLMGAGRQDSTYSERLSLFNFVQFYEKLGGDRFVNALRELLRFSYDYVLIDSRTGVSDTSGICTIQMPDTLVVCFTLNEQGIRGASGVASDVAAKRAKGGGVIPFRIFPVPMRIELSEQERRLIAMERVKKMFDTFLAGMDDKEKDDYWGQMQVVYIPYYAFEEIPTMFGNPANEAISMSASTNTMVRHITRGEVTNPGVIEERKRQRYRQRFVRSADDPLLLARQVVEKNAERLEVIRRLLLRFVVSGGGSKPDATRPLSLTDCAPDELPFVKEFVDAGVLLEDPDRTPPVLRLANDDLLRKWQLLSDWIEADREFLTWRNSVDSAAASWQRSNRNPLALLRDEQLRTAMKWERERGQCLVSDTLAFLRESKRNDPSVAAENFAAAIPEEVAPGFFLQFVTAGGSRRFVDAEDVYPGQQVVRQAMDLGLVREVTSGPSMKIAGGPGYSLVSDELVYRWPPLKRWLGENAPFLAARDEAELLARVWAEEQRNPRRLLRGQQLQRLILATKERNQGELTRLIRDFLAESDKGDPRQRAEQLLKTCPAQSVPALERLALRFISLEAGSPPKAVAVHSSDPDAEEDGLINRVLEASFISSAQPGYYKLTEPELISDWEWYHKLIERERDFLLLRTRLETQAKLWSGAGEKGYPLTASDFQAWTKATAARPSEGSGLLRRYIRTRVDAAKKRARLSLQVGAAVLAILVAAWLGYQRLNRDTLDPLSAIDPGMKRDTRAQLLAAAIQKGQEPGDKLSQALAKSVQDLSYLGTIAGTGTPSQKGWQFAFTGTDSLIAWSEQRIDVYTIQPQPTLPGYSKRTIDLGASACAYDPTSNALACSRKPGLLEFFDYESLTVKQAVPIKSQGKATVIRFSPNGKYWALGDDQGYVVYGPNPVALDLKYASFGQHGKSIEALDWADDNLHFATAAGVATAVIWDAQSDRSRVDLTPDPQSTVDDVKFALQGGGFSPMLAAAGSKGVWIWSDALAARLKIQPYGCGAYKIAFRGRTELAASVTDINCKASYRTQSGVMLWNAADGTYVGSVSATSQVQALLFSPDQRLLFIGDNQQSGVWSANIQGSITSTPPWALGGGSGPNAAFSADSKYLAASGTDGTYRVWSVDLSGFQAGAAYNPDILRRAICMTTSCP